MKVQISVSAAAAKKPVVKKPVKHKFAVGARVAVEQEKDQWFVGTVKKLTPTGARVACDDGVEDIYRYVDHRVVEVIAPRKMRKPITYAELKTINKALIDKAAQAKADEETRLAKEAEAAKIERARQREADKGKKQVEANRAKYKALSHQAVKVLSRWLNAYNATQEKDHTKFSLTFDQDHGTYGAWILADRKVRFVAYMTETIELYALPPYPVMHKGMTKDEVADYHKAVEKIDDLEWNHAEFSYDKFNLKAFTAFAHKTASIVGNSLKGLLFDPLAVKATQPQAKPTLKAAVPAAKPVPTVKPAVRPRSIRITKGD